MAVVNVSESSIQLPKETKRKAVALAKSEGISLKDFILLAVAEKLARMETSELARYKREDCLQ